MLTLILLIILLVVIIITVWKLPKAQIRILKKRIDRYNLPQLEVKDKIQLEKDFIQFENTFRTTVSQIIGGFIILIGIYFSIENLLNAQLSLNIAREGQITERFGKAVEQLGSDNVDINLGGIFALGRVGRDSPEDHWQVVQVLTAYLRRKTRLGSISGAQELYHSHILTKLPGCDFRYERPLEEVQAVMNVVSLRKWEYENFQFQAIHLENCFLEGVVITNTNLLGSSFASSDLLGSTFSYVNLDSSNFLAARLDGAQIANSTFKGAFLQHSNFLCSFLENIHFDDANLQYVDFRRSTINKVYFHNASLNGALLQGVDLRGAFDLTKEQLDVAITDEFTVRPDYLR